MREELRLNFPVCSFAVEFYFLKNFADFYKTSI